MRAWSLLVMVILLAGCFDGGDPPPAGSGGSRGDKDTRDDDDPATGAGEPVRFRTIAAGQDTGLDGPVFAAYDDMASWNAFWAQLMSARSDPPPAPLVDFDERRVIVVALETKSSGGWAVRIDNVTRDADLTQVRYTTYAPSEGAATATVLTQPYHIVVIPDGAGNVTFDEALVQGPLPPVPMRTLAQGTSSGIREQVTAELTDEPAWHALWARHVDGRDEPAPKVDFEKERVLVVALGERPDYQWNVTIWQLTIDGPDLVAWASVESPPDHARQPLVTQPFHFVAIPQGPPARFELVGGEDGAGDGGAGDASRNETGEDLMRTLAQGSQSGHRGDVRRIIESNEDWRSFWATHASSQLPPADAPEVDFGHERVVAVVLADKPNGCWTVRVENPNLGADAASVDVVTYTPPEGMMCTQQITQPFHFVALPHGAPLELREMQAQGPPPEA